MAIEDQWWADYSTQFYLSGMPGVPSLDRLNEMDRTDCPYDTYSRRRAMSVLWPRWRELAAGWNWIWGSLATLHAKIMAGVKQSHLPDKATSVLNKLARYDWVLLYECIGFTVASYSGWIRRQLLQTQGSLLEELNRHWLGFAAWLDGLSSCCGLLDAMASKEREQNNQKLLPHTPSVVESGLIAWRRELLLVPAMLSALNPAIQTLQDHSLGRQLDSMLVHLDVRDDHLSPWHRCMAEAPGDAAGCSAWYQGRMRAQVAENGRE